MLRAGLIVVHVLLALAIVAGVVMGNGESAGPAIFPVGLLAAIVWGLAARSRWVLLPAVLFLLLGTVLTGAMTIGNISWPESTIAYVFVGYLLFMILELAVIVVALRQFPRKQSWLPKS